MQQAGFEMATGMEYEGGGATYPQHATYGQQWQPPQQQPHPHPMMQPRAPAYSAPSSAYPSVEGGDLSNIEPIENASPVPVLDLVSEQEQATMRRVCARLLSHRLCRVCVCVAVECDPRFV